MTGLDDSAGRAQQPVRLALALLVCIVIALVAAGALSAYRLYTEANHRYLDQAVPVYAATQDVLVQMLNEQTGVRGFVITGDPVTLAPTAWGCCARLPTWKGSPPTPRPIRRSLPTWQR